MKKNTMEKWIRLLSNAIAHKIKSEGLLDEAVRELMRTKGFSEEQCQLFSACFAGGQETIVTSIMTEKTMILVWRIMAT